MRVDEFITNAPIKGLDFCILRWFARLDEVERHVMISSPSQHAVAAKLAAIIAAHDCRQSALEGNALDDTDDVGGMCQ